MSVIEISEQVLISHFGEEWQDPRAVADAYALWLADEYRLIASNIYPEHEIRAQVDVQALYRHGGSLIITSDDENLSSRELRHLKQVLRSEDHWQRWRDSVDAAPYLR